MKIHSMIVKVHTVPAKAISRSLSKPVPSKSVPVYKKIVYIHAILQPENNFTILKNVEFLLVQKKLLHNLNVQC